MSYDWEHLGYNGAGHQWGTGTRKGLHIHVAASVAVRPHKECPRLGPPGSPAGAVVDEIPGAAAAAGRGELGG